MTAGSPRPLAFLDSLWDSVKEAVGWVAGGLTSSAEDAVLGFIGAGLQSTVGFVVRSVHNLVIGLTTLVVTEVLRDDQGVRREWFQQAAGASETAEPGVYGMVWWVALVVMVGMFLIRMGRAALAANPREQLKALFLDIPSAFIGWAVFVIGAWALIALTQQLTDAMLAGGDVGFTQLYESGMFANVEVNVAAFTDFFSEVLVSLLVMIMWIFGATMIWIQLLVRTGFIFLSLAIAPVVFATMVGGTSEHAKKFAANTAALVLSKLIIVMTVVLGSNLYAATTMTGVDALGDTTTVKRTALCPAPEADTLRIFVHEDFGELDVFHYTEVTVNDANGNPRTEIQETHINAARPYSRAGSSGYAWRFDYSGKRGLGGGTVTEAYILRLADGASLAQREDDKTSLPVSEWIGPEGVIWADAGGRLHLRGILYPEQPFLDAAWIWDPAVGVGTLLGPTLPNPGGAEPGSASYERLRAWTDPPGSPYAQLPNEHDQVYSLGLDRDTALSSGWLNDLFGVAGDPAVEVFYTAAGTGGRVTCYQIAASEDIDISYSVTAQAAVGAMLVAAAFSPMVIFKLVPSMVAGATAAAMMTSNASQLIGSLKSSLGSVAGGIGKFGAARNAAAAARFQGASPNQARGAGRVQSGGGVMGTLGSWTGSRSRSRTQARAQERLLDRQSARDPGRNWDRSRFDERGERRG